MNLELLLYGTRLDLLLKAIVKKKALILIKIFAPVARLEAIRMLLAFASFQNFKLYLMNVKSAFLQGYLNEEVYFE